MGEKAGHEHRFQFYDADKGTFLGRTSISWLKITVFYAAYFTFLAGLFTASIKLMQSQLPDDRPKLNTRLNIPGLHFFPKFDMMEKKEKSRLGKNKGITFFWKDEASDAAGYDFYIAKTAKVLDGYLTDVYKKEAKPFDLETLGKCSPSKTGNKYGWDKGEPCIYFRLNRVIDWEPIGLFKPVEGSFFEKEHNGPTKPMVEAATYIRCIAKDADNNEITDKFFNYYGGSEDGGDGYVTKDFFPYKGKKEHPNYLAPIVAVEVVGLKPEKKYRVECNAHAKNIIIDPKANLGSIKFEIQNGGNADEA